MKPIFNNVEIESNGQRSWWENQGVESKGKGGEKIEKRLKVHSSNLSELKGELRRTIELSSMTHGLLLLLGLIMKDSIKTSK
jgi:hypothetical protein